MSTPTASGQVQAPAVRKTPKSIEFLAATLFLLACYVAPRATGVTIYTLAPGADITATGSSYPTGATQITSESTPFSFATINGTLISTVYRGDTSNPYGGLTFTYLLELNSTSSDSLSEFTLGGYSGFLTDVSYNQTGNEVAPSNFLRSGTGNVIHAQWESSAELPSGDTGALVVVQTSALGFGNNTGTVTDSSGGTVAILSAAVPEPGIASLLTVGFGAFFMFRRRSSK